MGVLFMAAEEKKVAKGPTTVNVKILSTTADGLNDIAEAKGLFLWQVIEDLIAAELPAAVKAVQPQLKKIRELKAKAAWL